MQEECDGSSTLDRETSKPNRSPVANCLQGDTTVDSNLQKVDAACLSAAEDSNGTGQGFIFDQNSSETDYQPSEPSDAGSDDEYSEGDEQDGPTHKDFEDIIQRAADSSGTGRSFYTIFSVILYRYKLTTTHRAVASATPFQLCLRETSRFRWTDL